MLRRGFSLLLLLGMISYEPLDPATVKAIATMFTSATGKAKGLFV